MSRFLGHQTRDTRIVKTDDRASLSNADSSLYVRSDGVVYDTDADIHYYSADAVTIASENYRAAGIHMVGPNEIADVGGTKTLYRVIANGHCDSSSVDISVGFGRGPSTITLAAAGDLPGKRYYLAGAGQSFQCDDLIGVDPWPTSDEDLGIVFFVYLHNTSSASVDTHAEFNLSVARLVGGRPMMHDQRLQ